MGTTGSRAIGTPGPIRSAEGTSVVSGVG